MASTIFTTWKWSFLLVVKLTFHVAPKSPYSTTFQVIQVICKRRARAPICSLVPTYQTESGSGAWLAVMLELFQSFRASFFCFYVPCFLPFPLLLLSYDVSVKHSASLPLPNSHFKKCFLSATNIFYQLVLCYMCKIYISWIWGSFKFPQNSKC